MRTENEAPGIHIPVFTTNITDRLTGAVIETF